ncbi:unnamed protein product [Euphydryas editha]|uniref:CCHC-type domain-containing protein n=1 Tax=Euphydryas editha TaxID=104508 RepID=A0AAU9UMU4_EUPED|nr:unnamed protein product [Euphydryas editha]
MAVASPSVIKLEGQRNWSVWKFQVTVTLKGVDVFSVIDGTFVESETGDKTAWVKKDVKAQSIIVSRLSEEAMIHVLTCETAAEMWKKLHSVFESKSATSTLMLQQRFLQCKFEEGELSIYLAKLQEMACQLKQAGETVSEKFLMTKVLMSLPESYSHFVSAWESVDTDKQNFNDLVARLLVEEERIQSKGHESESTALFLKKSGFVKRCNRCYVPGHLAKDCNSKVVLLDMSSEDEEIEQHEESEEEFHDTNTDEGEEQDKTPERTENISERTEEGRNQNETEYQTTGIGSQNSATEDQNQGQRSKRKIIKPNKLEDYYLDSNVDEIIGYVDSDWGGCNDRKSTTGCIFKVFGSSVMWFSKKQATVSLSSTEAEFIALCSATSEACWLKDILFIFGFDIKIVIFEDNQSTIKMAQMATGNSRVKHLEIKLSFVKEKLDKNIIELRYINTSDQLADILTKALGGTLFRKLRDRLFSK